MKRLILAVLVSSLVGCDQPNRHSRLPQVQVVPNSSGEGQTAIVNNPPQQNYNNGNAALEGAALGYMMYGATLRPIYGPSYNGPTIIGKRTVVIKEVQKPAPATSYIAPVPQRQVAVTPPSVAPRSYSPPPSPTAPRVSSYSAPSSSFSGSSGRR